MLLEYGSLVNNRGHIVIVGYNFNFLPHLLKREFGIGEYRKLWDFSQSGVRPDGIATVKQELETAGFQVQDIRWFDPHAPGPLPLLRRWPDQIFKRNWIVKARRPT